MAGGEGDLGDPERRVIPDLLDDQAQGHHDGEEDQGGRAKRRGPEDCTPPIYPKPIPALPAWLQPVRLRFESSPIRFERSQRDFSLPGAYAANPGLRIAIRTGIIRPPHGV